MKKEIRKFVSKRIALLLGLCMFAIYLFQCQDIYAANCISTYVEYDGKIYDGNKLSDETLKWLEWYKSLPLELQEQISYEPAELSNNDNWTKVLNVNLKADLFGEKTIGVMRLPDDLPTVYYGAPYYNPSYWNSKKNITHANCYAYALNYRTKEEKKLQPGDLSGNRFKELTKASIEKAAKADAPYLKYTITNTTKTAAQNRNQYKIALVIAPNSDYHWYIQNRDGYWSHKRGVGYATNLDSNGEKILDPQVCGRNYGNGLNYSVFCGYYMVTVLP